MLQEEKINAKRERALFLAMKKCLLNLTFLSSLSFRKVRKILVIIVAAKENALTRMFQACDPLNIYINMTKNKVTKILRLHASWLLQRQNDRLKQ